MGESFLSLHSCFKGTVILLSLLVMSLQGLADDTCFLAFSGSNQGQNTLTAPVIPPSDTASGNRVYLASFGILAGNFWEGNVARFALSADGEIVDRNGDPVTGVDGNIKAEAAPFWAARDWADPSKANYIANTDRNIYTYLGSSKDLTVASNRFESSNPLLTSKVLGNPTHTVPQIISYVRGADVFDENNNGDVSENRAVILGDVIHSEPLVVTYLLPDDSLESMVFFGANDGMVHAVLDSEVDPEGSETLFGTEAWAFIPPDQLHRLREMVEGIGHEFFIDSSPKVFLKDINGDGKVAAADGDQAVLVCGERKGGTSYFALDISDPQSPRFLWRINPSNDGPILDLPMGAAPDHVVPVLGESWSEPAFALVKTSDNDKTGTPVFFIGGGFSSDNSRGKAVLAVRVLDGSVLTIFENGSMGTSGMDYAIPSAVTVVDENGNGFPDKLYVGDLGGQMWRMGRFTDSEDNSLPFPQTDENIMNWRADILFTAGMPGDPPGDRKFFYPPSVTLEKGYDLVFAGTGDVQDACNPTSSDRIYAVKDDHGGGQLTELDLVDVTTFPPVPTLDDETADVDQNGYVDRGWYIRLPAGESVLSKGLVFNKVFYVTTFSPNQGGKATLYALNYKTGEPAFFSGEFTHNLGRAMEIGTSIPSRPVAAVNQEFQKVITGTTARSKTMQQKGVKGPYGAGILAINPPFPKVNFFYLWWKQL
jgi:type IV pilus assembly protein PilY1